MPKLQEWSVLIDGQHFHITFEYEWLRKRRLEVNGVPIMLAHIEWRMYLKSGWQSYLGIDQPLLLGGKEARFVLRGSKADIVLDGSCLDSSRPYLPSKKIPWWTCFFLAACAGIPLTGYGGVMPWIIGLLFAVPCIFAAASTKMKTAAKVAVCLGLSLAAWAVFIKLILMIAAASV